VTGTKLRLLPNDAFSNLRTLTCLDLRNNALEDISITVFDVPTLKDIYLTGENNSIKFYAQICQINKLWFKKIWQTKMYIIFFVKYTVQYFCSAKIFYVINELFNQNCIRLMRECWIINEDVLTKVIHWDVRKM